VEFAQKRKVAPNSAICAKAAPATRGIVGVRASEDIITVIDGRQELLDDVRASASQLRAYIAHEIGVLLQNSEFNQALPGHLAGDETSQARIPLIKERLRQLSLAA
jgi:hypothetical protein